MASLGEILKDPNYVNANAATKRAIFDKYAPQDPNYAQANEATQQAIRAKFGVETIAAPAVASEIPGARKPANLLDILIDKGPWNFTKEDFRKGLGGELSQINLRPAMTAVEPTVEAIGAIGGAALGTPLGPAGIVGGSGLGYGIAKQAIRLGKETLGMQPPQTGMQLVTEPLKDVATGATMEAAGRGVIAPLIEKGGRIISNLRDLKSRAYIEATEGRGQDIVNALRSPSATIVPGTEPSAGVVAAPVGSAKFSALQAEMQRVPGATTLYAEKAAQTNEARIAQEARVGERFQGVIDKVKGKINRNLVDVSQREVGEALIAAAKAEQEAVKKGVVQPAYDAAFKAAGNSKIDASNVVNAAETILERKLTDFAPETAPSTVRKLLSLKPAASETAPVLLGPSGKPIAQVNPPKAEATLQQLDDIRKAINLDIAAAKSSGGAGADMTLRNLYKLHDAIDEAVMGSKALPANAKQLYSDALSKYRDVYAPRFKTGVNANLFKQTSLNETKLNPDDVVKTFFQPRGEREAEQFLTMFGKNADAMKIGRTGIEDLYRQKVINAVTGEVDPAKHALFMKEYSRPISILDDGGMNLASRFDIIGKDAARLARVRELAEASGNKLSPALPAGSNALAIEQRIAELTKGMDSRQLALIDSVRKDILREAEFARLAAAGKPAEAGAQEMASAAGKEVGLPVTQLLSRPVAIFNAVFRRLTGRIDDKLALEIARELSSPALAADAIEKAMAKEATKRAGMPNLRQLAAPSILGTETAISNALAPKQENRNALAR